MSLQIGKNCNLSHLNNTELMRRTIVGRNRQNVYFHIKSDFSASDSENVKMCTSSQIQSDIVRYNMSYSAALKIAK